MGKHGGYKRVEPQRVYPRRDLHFRADTSLEEQCFNRNAFFDRVMPTIRRFEGPWERFPREKERERGKRKNKKKKTRREGRMRKGGGSFLHASTSLLFVRRLTSGNSCELVSATPSRDELLRWNNGGMPSLDSWARKFEWGWMGDGCLC